MSNNYLAKNPQAESDAARCFSEGCDARLDGKPRSTNPYIVGSAEGNAFDSGWRHTDYFWGIDAIIPAMPLPPVREVAAVA